MILLAIGSSGRPEALQEGAVQDDLLPVPQAALGQPAPLTGCIYAGAARRRAVPGPTRRPGHLRNGCPQLIHDPGPDGVIPGEFAKRPCVFPRHDNQLSTFLAVVVLPEPIIPSIKISRAAPSSQSDRRETVERDLYLR